MHDAANAAQPPLLLLLAPLELPGRDLLSASLATLARRGGFDFDVYYGALRPGTPWDGGDTERATAGAALGPNPANYDAHREFLHACARRSTAVLEAGPHPFLAAIEALRLPVLARSSDPWPLLEATCDHYGVEPPGETWVLDPEEFRPRDLIALLYPEICFRDRLALPAWTPIEHVRRARARGVRHEIAWEGPKHDALELSRHLVARHGRTTREVFLADPVVVAHWLPWCVRHEALALHAMPQVDAIREIEGLRCREHRVWGRPFDDRDLAELSRRGRAFQVVDPTVPAFPTGIEARPEERDWIADTASHEPTDRELLTWAKEGRILASVVFWAPGARALQDLPPILDVVHANGLRAGLAISSAMCRFAATSPLSMLLVPRAAGGCFPRLEPLLASSGVGVAFESLIGPSVLSEQLGCALDGLRGSGLLPRVRGWCAMLDGPLVDRKRAARRTARPYDRFDVGVPDPALHDAVHRAGLDYAISKHGAGNPTVLRLEDGFTVINHTAGRWAGSSPFVDVPDVATWRAAKRQAIARDGPGWLLGVIDTALWTSPHRLRERRAELTRLTATLTDRRAGERIVNVLPRTLTRYARLLHQQGILVAPTPSRPEHWSPDALGLASWDDHFGRTHERPRTDRRRST
ncbi:MAG: hypothetical protein H6833_09845 [Planctomycetes bacterium]|nr:hypothetical protein [Planctomycetota bacterium]